MENFPWYINAVFYQIYVRAYCDSNGDGQGDFRGLTSKLDYIASLGVDCLWIMPMYPSPLNDDGYDIADYYGIHPDYGTLEDFKKFLDEAHRRGLRVITDLVLNHTSDQHEWFRQARQSRDNPYRDYYVWSDTDEKYQGVRIIFLDTLDSNWTYDPHTGQYYWHRFYPSQPDLNFDNPEVREKMKDVVRFWLDLGVDGYRADAVPYLIEREGTSCENLPETHDYLKELRALMDEEYPDAVLLCEANMWPEDVRPYFGDGDEFHMGFHFPIMPRIYMAMKKGDATDMIDILNRTPQIPENCQWVTFLRNHDELTLEMVTEEDRQWMWEQYAPDPRMRLNLGIRRRLAPLLDNDPRKIRLACALLFSLPGSPIVYYGDEIGMGDNIWLFDRNGVRTPMQWSSGPFGGFMPNGPRSSEVEPYAPPIADPEYGVEVINVEAASGDPDSLLHFHKSLIAARKANPVLGAGGLRWARVDNPSVAAFWRETPDTRLLCVHNLSEDITTLDIPLPPDAGGKASAVFGEGRFERRDSSLRVHLEPYQFLWIKQAA